ncbi:hypothetical protein IE53DRAFT_382573 [Violaceomyces palustris]|uniref:Uncharacterized protein n=1 Tax=Violaceomyces palustris TaxID=1673888 RepID=A0ACD0NM55_9BASI|nr:hypothetical protein IE53DRAFT_382573 [Violaceomyces palustris]
MGPTPDSAASSILILDNLVTTIHTPNPLLPSFTVSSSSSSASSSSRSKAWTLRVMASSPLPRGPNQHRQHLHHHHHHDEVIPPPPSPASPVQVHMWLGSWKDQDLHRSTFQRTGDRDLESFCQRMESAWRKGAILLQARSPKGQLPRPPPWDHVKLILDPACQPPLRPAKMKLLLLQKDQALAQAFHALSLLGSKAFRSFAGMSSQFPPSLRGGGGGGGGDGPRRGLKREYVDGDRGFDRGLPSATSLPLPSSSSSSSLSSSRSTLPLPNPSQEALLSQKLQEMKKEREEERRKYRRLIGMESHASQASSKSMKTSLINPNRV